MDYTLFMGCEERPGRPGEPRDSEESIMADRVISYKIGEVTRDVTFTVKGGNADGTDWVRTLIRARVSDANKIRFEDNGIVQRVVDMAALSKDTKTGKSPSPQEKAERLQRGIDHYNSGSEEWSPARADGGLVLDGVLLAALAEAKYSNDVERARAKVIAGAAKHEMTPKEYLALAATADLVAPIVARMRQERVKGIDANAMLDEEDEEE